MISPATRKKTKRLVKLKAKNSLRERKFRLGVRLTDNSIPQYDSRKDPMCPIRFKKKSKRSKITEKEEAEEAKIIDKLLEDSLTFMDSSTLSAASVASSRFSKSTRVSHSSHGSRPRHKPKSSRSGVDVFRGHSRKIRPKTAQATLSSASLSRASVSSKRSLRSSSIASQSQIALESFGNITYQEGTMQDEDHAEDDVELLKHVLYREQGLVDLQNLSKAFLKIHPSVNTKSTQILAKMIEIIESMRTASLIIVEGIWYWRHKRIVSLLNRRRLPAPGVHHKPYPFVYDGDNYLLKMAFDTAFLDSLPPLVEWLGASFRRNTFFIKTEDSLDTISATNILDNGESVESASQNAPLPPEAPYIDRLRWASSVILSEESMRGQYVEKAKANAILNVAMKEIHEDAYGSENLKQPSSVNNTVKKIGKPGKPLSNEIKSMKDEIERRRRRRGEKADSLFYKDSSGGHNPSGSLRLMNMLKKNNDLRQKLEELKSELNKLSVETEALEAEEMEAISKDAIGIVEKKEGPTADPKTGMQDASGQYFKNFRPNY